MVITQSKSKRSSTGARYINYRKKKLYESGSEPTLTKVGKTNLKTTKGNGGNKKYKLLLTDIANIFDPKTKKYEKTKIKAVIENSANRQFIRRNIMTKGAVIETEKGKAKITSRPGQDGTINAILI
jgi:small subunit ribosomal protein S8e